MSIRFQQGNNCNISWHTEVKVTKYKSGNIDIMSTRRNNTNLRRYRKLPDNKYVDMQTGEILEYQKQDYKSKKSLKRTINTKLLPLLENNFKGGNSEKFVTLTFEDPFIEFSDLTRYFTNFWKRLTRAYEKKGIELDCIYVKELQKKRDAWHMHVWIKNRSNAPLFMDYYELTKLWNLGHVDIRDVPRKHNLNFLVSVDNCLENDEEDEYEKLKEYIAKTDSKENAIPTQGRFYGKKGNITYPITYHKKYYDVYKEELNEHLLKDEKTLLIIDNTSDKICNYIHKEKWIKKFKN